MADKSKFNASTDSVPTCDGVARIVIADDHPFIRLSVESALSKSPFFRVVGSVSNSSDLVAMLDAEQCDVLITDYAMPGGAHGDGMVLIAFLTARYPELRVIVFSGVDKPFLVQALTAQGIKQILSKADKITSLAPSVHAAMARRKYYSPTIINILTALEVAGAGRPLSSKELSVIEQIMKGMTVKEIAACVGKRKQTVSAQKMRAYEKLGIRSDADLFKYAAEIRAIIGA